MQGAENLPCRAAQTQSQDQATPWRGRNKQPHSIPNPRSDGFADDVFDGIAFCAKLDVPAVVWACLSPVHSRTRQAASGTRYHPCGIMGKRSFSEFSGSTNSSIAVGRPPADPATATGAQSRSPPVAQHEAPSTSKGTNSFSTQPQQPHPSLPQPSATGGSPHFHASLAGLTGWTVADIPETPPPLPPLATTELSHAVFTHFGTVANYGRSSVPSASAAWESYEALEWLGDSYLGMLSSHFIFFTFVMPQSGSGGNGGMTPIGPGSASFLRQLLVQNRTLARFSIMYGFHERVRVPPEFARDGRVGGTGAKENERRKVLGDVFEAYVGALIVGDPERGLETAASWLKTLWAGEIAETLRRGRFSEDRGSKGSIWNSFGPADNSWEFSVVTDGTRSKKAKGNQQGTETKEERHEDPQQKKPQGQQQQQSQKQQAQQPPGEVDLWRSKNELRTQIGLPDVNIRYVTVETDRTKNMKHRDLNVKMFTVECLLDGWGEKGVFLGRGTAKGVKEAGQKAARAALENKKRLKIYVDKKAAFLKARDGDRGPREAEQTGDTQ